MGVLTYYFAIFFSENRMKMKEFGTPGVGGARLLHPFGSANAKRLNLKWCTLFQTPKNKIRVGQRKTKMKC